MADDDTGEFYRWLQAAKRYNSYRDIRFATSMRAAQANDVETFRKYIDALSFDLPKPEPRVEDEHPDGPLGGLAAMMGIRKKQKEVK